MEWIPWDNVLATGHAALDGDHQRLVELFGQLTAGVKERKDKSVCAGLIENIIQHSKEHFEFEERLMVEHHYPKADQHAAEHARLIVQAIRFKAKFEAGAPGSHIDLIHFPEDWLTFHILAEDKALAEFLLARA
jgi:hemerythrin